MDKQRLKEIYISTDIEADGPIPGPHSMLSFGSAAFLHDGTMVSSFEANLETIEGATGHPDTMAWWKTQPEAWATCRENLQSPEKAMKDYVVWIKSLGKKPVFVGYPAGFDFTFIYWYLMRFAGESPYSFGALDIKTYAMARLNLPYRETVKRNMPDKWFSKRRHSHKALEDAIEQGELFINMLRDQPN